MNWKKVVSVLLVSAMTLSMAACGDTASTSDNAAAGTETKGSTANASSDEKLVVWTLSNDLIDFGKRLLSGYHRHPVQPAIHNQRSDLHNPVHCMVPGLNPRRNLHQRNPLTSLAHQR